MQMRRLQGDRDRDRPDAVQRSRNPDLENTGGRHVVDAEPDSCRTGDDEETAAICGRDHSPAQGNDTHQSETLSTKQISPPHRTTHHIM